MNCKNWKTRAVAMGRWLEIAAVGAALSPTSAKACAACYGQSDSPLAQGMNWGIFSLLSVIGLVLGGVGVFFFQLARRSAALNAAAASGNSRPAPVRESAAVAQPAG